MTARTIPAALEEQVRRAPDREVLTFLSAGGAAEPVTLARLHADAGAVGYSLLRQGVRPGDLVILAFEHGYPLVTAFIGAMYAGAVPSIFPYYTPGATPAHYQGRVQGLVRRAEARAILTVPAFAPALHDLMAGTGCPVLAVTPEENDGGNPGDFAIRQARPDDPAYIQFSSGSTGPPRGVIISHRIALNYLSTAAGRPGFEACRVTVGWLPFYHDMGLLTQLLEPLLLGIQSVSMAPQLWLREPVTLMRAIHRYRGTRSWMPNFGFAHCTRRIRESDMEGLDLSSWEMLGCGSEPVQFDVLQQFAERFAPYGFRSSALVAGYGMAETTLGVTRTPHGEAIRVIRISRPALQRERVARLVAEDEKEALRVVSCGVPPEGTGLEIVDDEDRPLPDRHVGEIRIRSRSLFAGYYRQPEATALALRDGWFYSGDLGFLLDGELYVIDRKKDLIITAGQNIYPHHVERAVQEAAGRRARRVVAFGVPDQLLATEVPVVVAELREEGEGARAPLREEIRRRAREELGVILADVRFVERGWIETTTSGKLARAATRQKYLDAGFRPPFAALAALESPEDDSLESLEAALTRIVATVTGREEIDPRAHLADLGVDSLALLQVILLIEEKVGRAVPVEQLALRPTIHHLARLLHEPRVVTMPVLAPTSESALYPLSPTRNRRQPLPRRLMLQRGPLLRGRALPYAAGTRLLRAIISNPHARQALYQQPVELLHHLLDMIPVKAEPQNVIRQSLMVNSWTSWRRLALAQQSTFHRWVTVSGEAHLHAPERERQGVVLLFPHTQLKALLPLLPVFHGRELIIIGNVGARSLARQGMAHLAGAVARGETLSTVAVRSAQLVNGLRVLHEGGVVVVAADEDDGTGGLQIPFHGRLRPFRPGAAELALRAGASLVPAFATLDVSGHITFEILEPLSPEGARHEQQVNSVLEQYATLLAERYTVDLGAMEWYILRKFLGYPMHSNNL